MGGTGSHWGWGVCSKLGATAGYWECGGWDWESLGPWQGELGVTGGVTMTSQELGVIEAGGVGYWDCA